MVKYKGDEHSSSGLKGEEIRYICDMIEGIKKQRE